MQRSIPNLIMVFLCADMSVSLDRDSYAYP